MAAPVLIGDEVTATGYRLAGVNVVVPAPEAAAITDALAQAHDADFVLITQEYAAQLPRPTLDAALTAISPPLVIVPDARNRVPLTGLATRLRAQLGVEE